MLKRTGMFNILTSAKFVLLVPTFVCALRSFFLIQGMEMDATLIYRRIRVQ